MISIPRLRYVLILIVVATAAASVSASPCDIFSKDGNPCVAAHSVIRALYSGYNGPLYRVMRASDKATADIKTTVAGGPANAKAQDAFCTGSGQSCSIVRIYDQSPRGNHLDLAPPGGASRTGDNGVNASRAPETLNGAKVYAAYFEGDMGYRIENTSGVATGNDPETLYMVTGGTHYNAGCCFDYGNAETDALDHGAGTMEAIYFGNSSGWGKGNGTGPWIMAGR